MVRHQREGRYDFWVAPGGGVNSGENAAAAAARETLEETGIEARPLKIAVIEELENPEERGCKLWFHCVMTGGKLSAGGHGATREYIVDAQFLSKEELVGKTIFPPILLNEEFWADAAAGFPHASYLGLRWMDFY